MPRNAPIAIPDLSMSFIYPGPRRPIHPLRMVIAAAIQIAQRQMRHIKIGQPICPRRLLAPIYPNPKKRQLKSKSLALLIRHVSRVIPPLRPILRMTEIIARKLVPVSRQRLLERTARAALPQKERRSQHQPLIPHAALPGDQAAPQATPDISPKPPSLNKPRRARPESPQPANENESSTQMTAC